MILNFQRLGVEDGFMGGAVLDNGNLLIADRYVCIARKISMKYLVSIPNKYKRCFCKHCYCYIFPNVNSRFRIKNGKIVIFCNNCEKFTRIPFKYKN